jgi:phosphatidylserine/phosphatidylglycerophosphate/cardiolipin synthase-like enzyme
VELSWARSLLGENGPQLLVKSLTAHHALDKRSVLLARGLSRFLSSLLGDVVPTDPQAEQTPELVWTLPHSHPAQSVRGRTYLGCGIRLIDEATSALALICPFIDPAGIGTLSLPLLQALSRGVAVRLFVHDALNIGTLTSRALEDLRREAEHKKVDLAVFSAEAGAGRDRLFNPLFHAKLIIRDDQALLVGSANLTSYALGSNFEAGVLLGKAAAQEALFILEGVLSAKAVYLVFRTKTSI